MLLLPLNSQKLLISFMIMLNLLSSRTLLLLFFMTCIQAVLPAQDYALVNATMIDVATGEIQSGMTVFV